MEIVRGMEQLREWRQGLSATETVGFVPTMGALHEGHRSLMARAQSENDVVVVSIFVNPTQFNDPDDFAKYPRTEQEDLELCRAWGVAAVFLPRAEEIYVDDFTFEVQEKVVSKAMCGAFRPGHFTGVLTVVLKLFNAVRPDRAYFGEKDYQQLKLIEGMVAAFLMPTKIVACATIREPDGLAMSSRNRRLNAADRELAAQIPSVLRRSANAQEAAAELAELGFAVDYVEDKWNRRFAAVHAGKVRLIDNVEL